jgi:hypothetical protein
MGRPNLFVLPQKRLVRWSVVLSILGKLCQQIKHKNEETQTRHLIYWKDKIPMNRKKLGKQLNRVKGAYKLHFFSKQIVVFQ